MSLEGKKVALTGAAGFIGSHLAEAIVREGGDLRAFVHYNSMGRWGHLDSLPIEILDSIEVVSGDIQNPFSVSNLISGCDVVFHLAALIGIPYSYVAPQSYIATNVTGTLNIMEASRQSGVERVIHTSTSETYGTALYTPIDEKHPLQAQSPYSASKIAADKIAESYHLSFEVPVVTLRPFNCFGPRQSARAVIPMIISQALTRPNIQLGSLSPRRDYTFVSDTARAFLMAAQDERTIGRLINVGSGKSSSIEEVVHLILELMEMNKPVKHLSGRVRPPKSEVMELVCDNRLANELLDWQPEVSFREGLAKTIDWINSNTDQYRSDIYNI